MKSKISSHVHIYKVGCSWQGTTKEGYENYDRNHTISFSSEVSTSLTLSSDPAFRGDPSKLNPEQLLVAAASSCQLLSFLAVAARARINVLEYYDEAEAEMPENDLPVRITTIKLKPKIKIESGTTQERVRHLVEVAHNECFIANSLKTNIIVEPLIEFVDLN